METVPATLNDAIAAQPLWLQGWVMVMVVVHALALVFIVHRTPAGWRVRPEPIAILVAFVAAGALMTWLFGQVGYVRLLGLAHLVFWGPVYVWILRRRRQIGAGSLFGKYVLLYLVIAGLSLVVDTLDVVRYVIGDG